MSEIFLGRASAIAGFERDVVIKRLLPHLAHDPDVGAALIDEARILSRLRHPNVVSAEAVGEEGDTVYLVLEHVRGQSLSTIARELRGRGARLDPAVAVHVVAELCAGLHAAHELRDARGEPLGVVHRDVSPHNVMLTVDGEVKLLDFGIAYCARGRAQRTQSGVAKGKFGYMAPEQLSGAALDRRADVFAAGVVLHELLTGRRLFARDTDAQTIAALLSERIPRPRDVVPGIGVPSGLEDACTRALARDPERRFASADAMRQALRRHLRTLDPGQDARERVAAIARGAQELARSRETATLPDVGWVAAARPDDGAARARASYEHPAIDVAVEVEVSGARSVGAGSAALELARAHGESAPAAGLSAAPTERPSSPSAERSSTLRLPRRGHGSRLLLALAAALTLAAGIALGAVAGPLLERSEVAHDRPGPLAP